MRCCEDCGGALVILDPNAYVTRIWRVGRGGRREEECQSGFMSYVTAKAATIPTPIAMIEGPEWAHRKLEHEVCSEKIALQNLPPNYSTTGKNAADSRKHRERSE